jgi:hypothetical protein
MRSDSAGCMQLPCMGGKGKIKRDVRAAERQDPFFFFRDRREEVFDLWMWMRTCT